MTFSSPIRIGVLGAAAIVPVALMGPARAIPEVQVAAVAARDPKRAQAFARRYKIPHIHPTYEDLIRDPGIDAIYNPLPNGLHAEWTIRALQAGKHVAGNRTHTQRGVRLSVSPAHLPRQRNPRCRRIRNDQTYRSAVLFFTSTHEQHPI